MSGGHCPECSFYPVARSAEACPKCGNTVFQGNQTETSWYECEDCDGKGTRTAPRLQETFWSGKEIVYVNFKCPTCNGAGKRSLTLHRDLRD